MTQTTLKPVSDEILKSLFHGLTLQNHVLAQQGLKQKFNCHYQNPPNSIPFETFVALIEFLRQTLYGNRPYDEGYVLIGQALLRGYLHGPTGIVNKLAAKVLGPLRGMEIFMRAIHSFVPDIIQSLEELKPGYIRYRLDKIIIPPGYMAGILKGALEVTGVKNLKVVWRHPAERATVYEFTWDVT